MKGKAYWKNNGTDCEKCRSRCQTPECLIIESDFCIRTTTFDTRFPAIETAWGAWCLGKKYNDEINTNINYELAPENLNHREWEEVK